MNGIEWIWVGWILTLVSWVVALWISFGSTRRTEVNKTIDLFQVMVRDVEDLSLKYWAGSADVYEYQLTLRLGRVAAAAKNVLKLDTRSSFPSHELSEFRKAVTLNIEEGSKDRTAASKARMQRIMIWSVKLQDHFSKSI